MVDLVGQYQGIKEEVDASISQILNTATFINGPEVHAFQERAWKTTLELNT